jgi:hypothetical protein
MSLDVPNRFFKMGFQNGRKQGAIEELQKLNRLLGINTSFPNDRLWEVADYIQRRLKELES